MKLFGNDLFNFKKPAGKLYDFAQHGILNARESFDLWTTAQMDDQEGMQALEDGIKHNEKIAKEKKEAESKPKPTPKQIFNMKALNDNDFKIIVDPDYLDSNIEMLKEKLELLGKAPKRKKSKTPFQILSPDELYERGDLKFSREELTDLIERLTNRRVIADYNDMLNKYPHTTSQLINKVINDNRHLRASEYSQFVPELPKEAVKAVKEYDEMCLKLCNKKTSFYMIAKKSDFDRAPARRDPILLAESPFGHFWQILGAWDDEMMYLGDL